MGAQIAVKRAKMARIRLSNMYEHAHTMMRKEYSMMLAKTEAKTTRKAGEFVD